MVSRCFIEIFKIIIRIFFRHLWFFFFIQSFRKVWTRCKLIRLFNVLSWIAFDNGRIIFNSYSFSIWSCSINQFSILINSKLSIIINRCCDFFSTCKLLFRFMEGFHYLMIQNLLYCYSFIWIKCNHFFYQISKTCWNIF